VVILADMTANLAAREAERFVDGNLCATRLLGAAPWELLEHERHEHTRELAEGVRVAYVAATRARDLLVIPAVGDEERDGWLGPAQQSHLSGARPAPREGRRQGLPGIRRRPHRAGTPHGVLRAARGFRAPRPAYPQAGDHQVVWWDPIGLRLDVAPGFGLRQEDILAPEPAARAAEGIARYRQWQQERQADHRSAASFRPSESFLPRRVSKSRRSADVVYLEDASTAAERPGGRRFGMLVHAILRDLDLGGTPPKSPRWRGCMRACWMRPAKKPMPPPRRWKLPGRIRCWHARAPPTRCHRECRSTCAWKTGGCSKA
jgi:ATP-dependent helicase/nuclease subunit A